MTKKIQISGFFSSPSHFATVFQMSKSFLRSRVGYSFLADECRVLYFNQDYKELQQIVSCHLPWKNSKKSRSEISPRHSFLRKNFRCVHMRSRAGPVTEDLSFCHRGLGNRDKNFPHMNTPAWETGTKLFRQNSFAFAS